MTKRVFRIIKLKKMISTLRNLFNNGDNNGTIIIKTFDKDLKCHKFVLSNTSEYFKESIEQATFDNVITLDVSTELLIIVLNFLYSEKIIDKELSGIDIIKLFALISQLRCVDFVINLKNYYLKKFPKTINENNWLFLLENVYNTMKYSDLQEELLRYFQNNILSNIEKSKIQVLKIAIDETASEIKQTLFLICLKDL